MPLDGAWIGVLFFLVWFGVVGRSPTRFVLTTVVSFWPPSSCVMVVRHGARKRKVQKGGVGFGLCDLMPEL